MEHQEFRETNIISMSCLTFTLPEAMYSFDIEITIEYLRYDMRPDTVHCWAWAQIGDFKMRSLIAEYDAPYSNNNDKLIQAIVGTLNIDDDFRMYINNFIKFLEDTRPDLK